MREYRKKYPDRTIKALRKEIAKLEQSLVYAIDEGREQSIREIDRLIDPYGGWCKYEDGKIRIHMNDNTLEAKL